MKNLIPTIMSRRIVLLLLVFCISLTLVSCLNKDTTEPEIPELEDQGPYQFRPEWDLASTPLTEGLAKAWVNYFNPQDFYCRDVFEDSILDESQYFEKLQVLRCKLKSGVSNDSIGIGRYWSGIMRYVDNQVSFDEMDYLEIKILDNDEVFPEVPVTMHIDLGRISEEFYWGGPGNLDTEDINNNGLLDEGEDTGFDGIPSGHMGDWINDDYSSEGTEVLGYDEYQEINRREGNNRLDSEDLDGDGELDDANAYYEYSIDLFSDEYLHEVNSRGLRTYRIPKDVYETFSDGINYPNQWNLKYLRFWFEYEDPTYVVLVSAKFESYEERGGSFDLLK